MFDKKVKVDINYEVVFSMFGMKVSLMGIVREGDRLLGQYRPEMYIFDKKVKESFVKQFNQILNDDPAIEKSISDVGIKDFATTISQLDRFFVDSYDGEIKELKDLCIKVLWYVNSNAEVYKSKATRIKLG